MTTSIELPEELPEIRFVVDATHIDKLFETVARVRSVEIGRQQEGALIEYDGAHPRELRASAKAAGFHPGAG